MASIFSLRRTADEDGRSAGGKIMRNKRARAAEITPYSRPTPVEAPTEDPVAESSGNPNWLSGLILPARAIASGAGKILSSVFGPDYASSSSSSSDGDCFSEEEKDDASNAADVELDKAKSEKLQLIQQLVMQQTFSRDECDELVKLIRSRVAVGDGNISNTDACNDAVLEARKWLEERRSASKSVIEDQIFDTNQATQSDMGSPVNMAKSYMQAQPAWSSPALKRVEFSTPSPMQSSKEFFRNPVQLAEMKRSGLSSGSWNILDEIRRVRSKATEELLAKTPSKKVTSNSDILGDMSVENTATKNVNDKNLGDELNSDPNISLGLPDTNGCSLPESVEMESEKSQDGVVKQRQDDEPFQVFGDSDAANGFHPSHETDGLRDSATDNHATDNHATDNHATDNHAISLSAPEQPLEQQGKEKAHVGDSIKEKDNGDDNLIASQDSSSMAYEDLSQDMTTGSPNQTRKNPARARKLRPRNKTGKYH